MEDSDVKELYVCQICGRIEKTQKELLKHLRSVHDMMNDSDEEIFSSLGPYECEVCQHITKTKEDFYAHVKSLHMGEMDLDEDVLRCLKIDLNKRKKKAQSNKGDCHASHLFSALYLCSSHDSLLTRVPHGATLSHNRAA